MKLLKILYLHIHITRSLKANFSYQDFTERMVRWRIANKDNTSFTETQMNFKYNLKCWGTY